MFILDIVVVGVPDDTLVGLLLLSTVKTVEKALLFGSFRKYFFIGAQLNETDIS
jgi:hypothetical protein